MNTNQKRKSLIKPYGKALQSYLATGRASDLRHAKVVGEQARSIGVETLDLAWVHEAVMDTAEPATGTAAEKRAALKRSRAFFAACQQSLVANPPADEAAQARWVDLKKSLSQSRRELKTAQRLLTNEKARGETLAEKLRQSQLATDDSLRKVRNLHRQMSILSRGILFQQEEERKRISRELHDIVAQLLSAIHIRLAKMNVDILKDNRTVRKNIQSTQRLVEKSVQVVHRFARELRPMSLDELGLIPALRSLTVDASKQIGIRVNLTLYAGIERMKIEKRTILYRVAQEALSNIRKYANAGNVEMSIRQHPGIVRMIIHDDGRGFDVEKTFPNKPTKCLGLLGMRERVEMVGGTFSVTSSPGNGCTLQADIPFAPQKKVRTAT